MFELAGSSELVKQIEAEAFRLGFCLFGVTSAERPQNYRIYEAWLAWGLNAGMSYMASEYHRNCRQDPHLLFADVKSILVVAWPYALTLPSESTNRGWIAGYATGEDYHQRLIQPLRELVSYIENAVGRAIENRIYTDSSPILERELAQRAGLGWIARNSCLISPDVGSNFLLAEVFLELELPASPPFSGDRCGTCHRCVDACPTHCIRDDRSIDAGKCISYLTIENKDGMPQEFWESVGNWAFGCDICQLVCPWNTHRARLIYEPARGSYLEMEEMAGALGMDSKEFKGKFASSAILRSKRSGFLRNLITVLGNAKDERAISALNELLKTEADESLREMARRSLAKIVG